MFSKKLFTITIIILASFNSLYPMRQVARKISGFTVPIRLTNTPTRTTFLSTANIGQQYCSIPINWSNPNRQYSRSASYKFKPRNLALIAGAGTGLALFTLYKNKEAQAQEASAPKSKKNYLDQLRELDNARQKFYAILESKPYAEVCKKYIKKLQAEEAEILEKICSALGITLEELENCKKPEFYLNNKTPAWSEQDCYYEPQIITIPSKQRKIIETLLKQYCDYSEPVELNLDQNNSTMYVSTILFANKTLEFNLNICKKDLNCNADEFEATVLHEIQHILHYDSFNTRVIEKAINKWGGKDSICFKPLFTEWLKFQEKRADILSCLVDPRYALSRAYRTKRRYEQTIERSVFTVRSSDDPEIYPEHPTWFERFTLARQIYSEISPGSPLPAISSESYRPKIVSPAVITGTTLVAAKIIAGLVRPQ